MFCLWLWCIIGVKHHGAAALVYTVKFLKKRTARVGCGFKAPPRRASVGICAALSQGKAVKFSLIYVTGDMHGVVARFEDKQMDKLRRDDILIICGDFGFIWNGGKQEEKVLEFMERQKYKILFVDGCHENFDRLYNYPLEQWHGGAVHKINDNVLHLCRGQIFELDGKSIFTMGGGYSSDAELRRSRGMRWWEEETPSRAEIEEAVNKLYEHSLEVDYIVTHECPTAVKSLISHDPNAFNSLTAFFDELCSMVKYKHWFFGSQHVDRHISSKHTAVYNEVVPLEVPKKTFSPQMNRYFAKRSARRERDGAPNDVQGVTDEGSENWQA